MDISAVVPALAASSHLIGRVQALEAQAQADRVLHQRLQADLADRERCDHFSHF